MRKVVKVAVSVNDVPVFEPSNISRADMKRLREMGFVRTDPVTHKVSWTAPAYTHAGVYKSLKMLCKQGRVYNFGGYVMYSTAEIK